MSTHKVTPEERSAVMDLLKRWHEAIERIDEATGRMKQIAANRSLGIQSMEYEVARVGAMAVVHEVRQQTQDDAFWPALTGRKAPAIKEQLKQKMDEATGCQLNLLRVWGLAAEAFRTGKEHSAPSIEELMSLSGDYTRLLGEMGAIGVSLAVWYKITAKELEG